MPQCYDKALRRWEQLDPRSRGPKPALPTRQAPLTPPAELEKYGGIVNKMTPQGRTNQMSTRTPITQQQQQLDLYANTPVQLSKCRKCGRGFAYDRIQYHESVCIGNKSRKQFNSKKQRLSDFDQYELKAAAGGNGPSRKGAGAAVASRRAPSNQTSWRQQHNEFISAIRSAKQYERQSKPLYSAPAPAPRQQRQPFASNALRNPQTYRNPPQATRSAPQQKPRDPLPRVGRGGSSGASFQFDAPQQPMSRNMPPQRNSGYGGGGGGFGGGGGGGGFGGGGGGKVSIVNSNVTSSGMLEAFGRR